MPLWRGDERNRYRKRRRVAMRLDPEVRRSPNKGADAKAAAAAIARAAVQENDEEEASSTTKMQNVQLHMVGFAKDVILDQRRRMDRRKPSCLDEEEQAAILLMALSSDVIYA